jgi:hypothetical protein
MTSYIIYIYIYIYIQDHIEGSEHNPEMNILRFNVIEDINRFHQVSELNGDKFGYGRHFSFVPDFDTQVGDTSIFYQEGLACHMLFILKHLKDKYNQAAEAHMRIFTTRKIKDSDSSKAASGPVDIKLLSARRKADSESHANEY